MCTLELNRKLCEWQNGLVVAAAITPTHTNLSETNQNESFKMLICRVEMKIKLSMSMENKIMLPIHTRLYFESEREEKRKFSLHFGCYTTP